MAGTSNQDIIDKKVRNNITSYGELQMGKNDSGKATFVKVTDEGKVKTSTELNESDSQIGAVEIKDGESDTRLKIKSDGTDNAAVVTQNSQPLPIGASTSDNQTNGTQKTRVLDGDGNQISDDNPLPVKIRPIGISDSNNSTFTLLPADTGGTDHIFEGTVTNISGYVVIGLLVHSDVASATKGLKVWFSPDGISNWVVGESYTVVAGSTKFFTPTLQTNYYKITYENGDSAQSDFFLNSNLRTTASKWSSHNINESISEEDDAELVKSVITGEDPEGNFNNVQTTKDGNLAISDNSSGLAISEGLVTDKTFVHKFGLAPDFDYGDGEVNIWDGAWQLKQIMSISDAATSYLQHTYEDPEKFKGKVDMMITVEATETGATGASISAGFDLVLKDD